MPALLLVVCVGSLTSLASVASVEKDPAALLATSIYS